MRSYFRELLATLKSIDKSLKLLAKCVTFSGTNAPGAIRTSTKYDH